MEGEDERTKIETSASENVLFRPVIRAHADIQPAAEGADFHTAPKGGVEEASMEDTAVRHRCSLTPDTNSG